MATKTTVQTPTVRLTSGPVEVKEDSPEWLKEFNARGWTVVPEAVPRESALAYADKGYEWLESWSLGFDRNDRSTHKAANLPWHIRGGLYFKYGIGHEQFVWDLKSEPGLVDKFEKVWGTKKLLVSYDGINLSLPEQERPKTDPLFAPWSHVDQSPLRPYFDCVQGILNLLPNGPDDGGLMVLDGSSKYYTELWEHFDHKKPEGGWNERAYQNVDAEMCQWLESKGCKWVKICAQPGDLMLWDSRTIHYGAAPSSTNPRFAAYVCYKPADSISTQTKAWLLESFEKRECTTHDPAAPRGKTRLPPDDHPTYEEAKRRPVQQPVLTPRAKQLAGLVPY
ncbi:hypothetical protein SEUCBS140593_002031 [Sporothrix eucalyptigena]|uniref:Phytanoyl-CoA dioxygenase n=1 Tax=Sporothrix eucalyptigena TaxID=1812306 RepID=A0ABP0B3C4_9PEZI